METESIPGLEEKASLTRSKLKEFKDFEPKGVPESVECTGLALLLCYYAFKNHISGKSFQSQPITASKN